MRINIQTKIKTNNSLLDVFGLFNKEMFFYLTENAPVNPIRYDGDFKGAEIHLQMIFPWKDDWVSVITDRQISDDICFFVDEGKKLPFNISKWKHTHIIRQFEDDIIVEDDIYFESSNYFFDRFWWVCFMPQFLVRKIQYKNYINLKLS